MTPNAQKLLSARITEHLLRGVKRPLTRWLFGQTDKGMDPDQRRIYKRICKRIEFHRNPEKIRGHARAFRQRFYAIGLTGIGTPRKYRILGQPKTRQEIAWRQFRATGELPK